MITGPLFIAAYKQPLRRNPRTPLGYEHNLLFLLQIITIFVLFCLAVLAQSITYKRLVAVLLFALFTGTSCDLFAQDSGDLYCEKPKGRPRGDKHMNCKDISLRRQGVWKFYSADGLLLSELNYKDNKMHGPGIWYYSATGRIRVTSNYFDGKKDGEYESFFFNGQTQMQGEYTYGKRTGTWTFYYSTTGETRQTGKYVNGKMHGTWKYYKSNGKMTKSVDYDMGKAINTIVVPPSDTKTTPPPPVATTPPK